MKTTKRFFVLLLSFALVLTVFTGNTEATANTENTGTITVTLRAEGTDKTLIAPTTVTLTQADVATINSTYTMESGSTEVPILTQENATAAHAIAKYMMDTSSTPTEDLIFSTSNFGDFCVNVGSIKNDQKPASAYWCYRVNNTSPAVGSMNLYQLKDGDDIVLYLSDYDYSTGASTAYSFFDKDSYETTIGETLHVTLKKEIGWDGTTGPASTETVSVENGTETVKTVVTDENGTASLNFDTAGTYIIRSSNLSESGFPNTSRSYAVVTVKAKEVQATSAPTATPAPQEVKQNTVMPEHHSCIIFKPLIPTKLKAKVKKKKVTISWKKAKRAEKYVVYVSKKNKKNFKKLTTTKKTKITKKFKKGKYFVKVRSYYKKSNGRKIYSNFSKVIKVKVK